MNSSEQQQEDQSPTTGPAQQSGSSDPRSVIEGLYHLLLNRSSDQGGMDHYLALYNGGWSEDQIRQDMMKSGEYQQKHPDTSQPPQEGDTMGTPWDKLSPAEQLSNYRTALTQIAQALAPDDFVDQPARTHVAWATRIARGWLAWGGKWVDPVHLQPMATPEWVPAHQVALHLLRADDQIIVQERPGRTQEPIPQDPFLKQAGGDKIHLVITSSQRAEGYEARAYRLPPDKDGNEYLLAGIARWEQRFCADPIFCFCHLVPPMWRWAKSDTYWYPAAKQPLVPILEAALRDAWGRVANTAQAQKLASLKERLPRMEVVWAGKIVDSHGCGVRATDVVPILENNVVLMMYPSSQNVTYDYHGVRVQCLAFSLSSDILAILDQTPNANPVAPESAWFFRRSADGHWDPLSAEVPEQAKIIAQWETLIRLAR